MKSYSRSLEFDYRPRTYAKLEAARSEERSKRRRQIGNFFVILGPSPAWPLWAASPTRRKRSPRAHALSRFKKTCVPASALLPGRQERSFRYRGRVVTEAEIAFIRRLIADDPSASRRRLSELEHSWCRNATIDQRGPNGRPANMDFKEVTSILASFEKEGLDYVLIGAVALSFHGISRATQDIDVFVRPDPSNIARLRRALKAVYDDPSIDKITAEDLCGGYPAVRYCPPHGSFFVDILTRLGEFAGYDDLGVEEIEIEGVPVKVATPKTLFWLQKSTVRSVDRADAELLREKFQLAEESDREDSGE